MNATLVECREAVPHAGQALHNGAEAVLANTPFLLTRCSSDLRYLFVSEAYARMIGRSPEEVIGRKIIEIIGDAGFNTILPHIKSVLFGQRVEYEQHVHFKDVGPRLLHVIYTPDKDHFGQVRGWVASIIDITAKRLAEERIAADLHATMLLRDVSSECVREDATVEQCLYRILDAGIVITGAQKGNIQLLAPSSDSLRIAAHHGFDKPFLKFFENVSNEAAACSVALQTGARIVVEDVSTSKIFAGQPSLKVLLDEGIRAVTSTPLVSSKGHTLGMLSTHFRERQVPQQRELQFLDLLARLAADYLERKRAEDTEKLLLREVQHRSNNLLTVVQAIAHQTFSGAKSFDDAKKAFEGRLQSLARCNKQITKSITGQVRLHDIIHLQVEPFAGRVSAHGPDISIGPQQAQNLSMLLHELVTNAAKHGALRTPRGKVEVTWLLNQLHEALQLTWQERDGPPVEPPRHSGFGTMLLKATFPKAQLDYQPGGLLCQVDVSIAKDNATAGALRSSERTATET